MGLTGGLCSGKSEVAEMFARRGVHLLHADKLAHELMQPGQPVYYQVVNHFGREIVQADGNIDRPKLAALAFEPGRIQELNRIVHPAVVKKQEAWMDELAQREPHGIAMVEAALIVEAGVQKRFDKLVVVTCTPEQKIERFAARSPDADKEAARREAQRRLAAQLPDEEKVRLAHFVIDNSGTLDATEQQVEKILMDLKAAAAER
ncbi:MAG: dephospho-CoA kinase [Terriglobales bacterium]